MNSAVKVNFHIGHVASARVEPTPEGFTHDWEIYVRGPDGVDISHFIEKVVFNLHATFKNPRRVIKKPPFSIKESGYGGFTLPIDIYLKNKGSPKQIQFSYDFTLQDYGILKDRYIFRNPNAEFRKKLLMGGGIPVTNEINYYSNSTQQNKLPVSYPRLPSNNNKKKNKPTAHQDTSMSFEKLFGATIQIPPTKSPQPKTNIETGTSSSKTIHKQEKSKKKSIKRQRSNERIPPSSDVRKKRRVASPAKIKSSPSNFKVDVKKKLSETLENDVVSPKFNGTVRNERTVRTTNKINYHSKPNQQNKLPFSRAMLSSIINKKNKSTAHQDTSKSFVKLFEATTQIPPTISTEPKNNIENGTSGSETVHKREHQQEKSRKKSTKRQRSNERIPPSSDIRKKKRVASPAKMINIKSNSKVEVERKLSKTNSPETSESGVVSLEHDESSGSISAEKKHYQPAYLELENFSPNHMADLVNLGRRIVEMMENNEKVDEIVNIVRDSEYYTICDSEFVFDVGMLDDYTVQRLIQLIS